MTRLSRLYLVALVTLVPSLVFAQDKITTALNQGSKWFSTITLAIGGIGLATTGWKYFFGKPDARQSLESNFLGFGVCLGAGTIIELFRRWMG